MSGSPAVASDHHCSDTGAKRLEKELYRAAFDNAGAGTIISEKQNHIPGQRRICQNERIPQARN